MLRRTSLCLWFFALLWISSPAVFPQALDPSTVPIHPDLEKTYLDFFPPAVIEVTDGVYVARGYNRDNPTLIEGPAGLIVIDPGESILAGQAVKSAFNAHLGNIFDKKPVKAVIYTHSHDCHIHGAAAFADEHTEIISHENLMSALFDEWYGQVYPSRLVGGAMMAGIPFLNNPGWYAGYVLSGPQSLGPSGFLPPTRTVKDRLKITIAGVKFELISAPAETREVIVTWLPQKKVLIEIGIVYDAFPALTTMRGSGQRNPLDYIGSLKLCRDLEPEYLVKLHGAHPVMEGKENIRRFLTDFSDAIQFIHDQTVQYLNKGLAPGEIMNLVELPPHLADSPYLQETYGRIDWDVDHIFRFYRGYYTGKIRDLFPQSPTSEAGMAAELAGGIDELAAKAEAALVAGKLEWALELADDVLLLEPENDSALETKKSAMLSLAGESMNSQARNMLLSDYLILTGQVQLPTTNVKTLFSRMDNNAVQLMPMASLFRIMAVNLDASRSVETDMIVGLELTDLSGKSPVEPSRYRLHVRRGILEVEADHPDDAEFLIVTDSRTWKDLNLGKLNPQSAVSEGSVSISGGSVQGFYDFLGLFY